jgi:hypothetical protein
MERIRIERKAAAMVAAALVAMLLLGGAAFAALQPAAGVFGGGAKGDLMGAAATYIGVTVEELRAELEAGKTLAQVATERGKTRDGLVAALTNTANAAIDQKAADGSITAERAAELKAAVPAQIERLVDREGPLRGAGCRDRNGNGDSDGSSRFSPERDGAGRGSVVFGRP